MRSKLKKTTWFKPWGFGEYLVSNNIITQEQYLRAKAVQNTNRLMGIIAKAEKYLSDEQVEKIVEHLIEHPGLKFGEAALAVGFLDASQLRHLLHICMTRKTRLGEILLTLGFIDKKKLAVSLETFHSNRKKLGKVLVAEPSGDLARNMESILKRYGYEAKVAYDEKAAKVILAEFKPDVLIASDAADSGLDGLRLIRSAADKGPDAPIASILASQTVSKEVLDKATEAGAKYVLRKSFKESELIDVVMHMEELAFNRRTEKILVVDDSPLARKVILEELSPIWDDIQVAENGKEAVELARLLKPDIVTMDVEMPVMNGMDACRTMSNDQATENIPVVFITANNTVEFREEGFAAGAVEYFTKPFKNGQLAAFIKSLFDMRKSKKDGRIMIVEDVPAARHILSYLLEKNGYDIMGAKNGRESLSAMKSFEPDLVVTGSRMPEMDGFELTKRLKEDEKTRSIPVIMLTSSKEKGDALKSLEAGAVDYIVKPFDEPEMMARLQVHIKNKRLMEEVFEEKEKLKEALAKLEEANKMLGRLAVMDGLTGLANRRHFDEVIAVEWSRALRESQPISFLMLDIDFFKKFNDGYGHQQGDTCLRAVAEVIKGAVKRVTDFPARYGGEEFAIILPLTNEEWAGRVAEEIRAAVAARNIPHKFSEVADRVTVSIGCATVNPSDPEIPGNYREVIEMADKALYSSKKSGRNRVCHAKKYSQIHADAAQS